MSRPLLVLWIVLSAALIVLLILHLRVRRHCVFLNGALSRSLQQAQSSRRAMDELKRKESARDEFISTVSHELRTPLTSIRGSLGLLSSGILGPIDDRAANLLRIATSNTDRLVRLLNDVLDLQRMDSELTPLPLRPCLVGEVVHHAIETMATMADSAGIHIKAVWDRHMEHLVVEGDPDRLQQVLCNLLSNAIKFSPSHTTVYVRGAIEGEELALRVEDQGRGVPADQLESIFERFRQLEHPDGRHKGGSGLGLPICRSILLQHHGSICAQRNDAFHEGKTGLTLVIRLPLPAKKASLPSVTHFLLA